MRKCGIWHRGTFWLHSEWILNKNTHSAKLKSSASWTFPVKRLRCANSPCVFTVSISTSYLKEMPEPTPSKLWILSFQLSSHHNNEALYSPPPPCGLPHTCMLTIGPFLHLLKAEFSFLSFSFLRARVTGVFSSSAFTWLRYGGVSGGYSLVFWFALWNCVFSHVT